MAYGKRSKVESSIKQEPTTVVKSTMTEQEKPNEMEYYQSCKNRVYQKDGEPHVFVIRNTEQKQNFCRFGIRSKETVEMVLNGILATTFPKKELVKNNSGYISEYLVEDFSVLVEVYGCTPKPTSGSTAYGGTYHAVNLPPQNGNSINVCLFVSSEGKFRYRLTNDRIKKMGVYLYLNEVLELISYFNEFYKVFPDSCLTVAPRIQYRIDDVDIDSD